MRSGWSVRVPASSANLGAAFDAVAVVLDTHLEVTADGSEPAPETHPAVRAVPSRGWRGRARPCGVTFPAGEAWGSRAPRASPGSSPQPYSATCRCAPACREVLPAATGLEGHADNVAASLLGGVVAVAGGRAVRVPLGRELAVVLWVPDRETATTSARRHLPDQVAFDDAAFNVGRTALLIAALGRRRRRRVANGNRGPTASGPAALARPETRIAIDTALRAGAFGAWVSGSGPSAAAFADPARAPEIASAMPAGGRAIVLDIAEEGATVTSRSKQ